MAGRLKPESVKLLACLTSLSLQLQNLLLVYITRRKILNNLSKGSVSNLTVDLDQFGTNLGVVICFSNLMKPLFGMEALL